MKVYHGSSVEALAERIVSELKAERKSKDPFEFLRVAVANPNLSKWLQMKILGKEPSLGAGMEFPFAEAMMAEILLENLPAGKELELKRERDYAIAILQLLLSNRIEEFASFRSYIMDGADDKPLSIDSPCTARKAWQLSYKLGELIDSYEANGCIDRLESESKKNAVFRGEWKLATLLLGEDGAMAKSGKTSLRELFIRVKGKKPKGPAKKLRLFGFSSLTLLQTQIIAWLSQTHDVELYFIGDVNEANSDGTLRNASDEGDRIISGFHAAGDRTVRDICRSLRNTYGNAIYPDEKTDGQHRTDTVLGRCQCAIANEPLPAAVPGIPQDASFQVVGAPGIRREIETVHDAILGAVWEKNSDGKPVRRNGMSFSDVAVLVSDMKTYRPIIESVFKGRGQIPYGLIDITSDDYSQILAGFLALMELARNGLSRSRLFEVLENPCVQRAMSFSEKDVAKWRDITDRLGAYDGYDSNSSGNFNWECALKRLKDDNGKTKDVEPSQTSEIGDKDVSERFAAVVETLYSETSKFKSGAAVCSSADAKSWENSWAGRIHDLMDKFLAADPRNEVETRVRSKIVQVLNELSVIEGEGDFELSVAAVEHSVTGIACAEGGCIKSGVTIGGLRSLAHVPFKQIFIVGLGEGTLPHKDVLSTLDLRSKLSDEERWGLKTSDEDGDRFLAAVLSARDRLVLTYPSRNIQEDAPLYPSSFVRAMETVVSERVIKEAFKEFTDIPLVESEAAGSPSNEDQFAGLGMSYSVAAWTLSGQLAQRNTEPDSEQKGKVDENKVQDSQPTTKDLAEFVKDPFTAIFKRRLKVATEGCRNTRLEDDSPLGIDSKAIEWALQKKAFSGESQFSETFSRYQNEGRIPTGFLGEFAKEKAKGEIVDAIEKMKQSNQISDDDVRSLVSASADPASRVICRQFNFGSKRKVITIPPDAILEPFFEWLSIKSRNKSGGNERHSFVIKVINIKDEKVRSWKWELGQEEIDSYLDSVRKCYLGFLTSGQSSGLPCVTYKDFRETQIGIDGDIKYKNVCAVSDPDKERYDYGNGKFDNSIVIDSLSQDFKRRITEEELKNLYNNIWKLPMSGIMMNA